MVLTGMNALEQVMDNAATAVACTGCAYCTYGCPKGIAIPQYFSLYNNAMRNTGTFSSQGFYYKSLAITHGMAGGCTGCGQCKTACPQHLPIVEKLKDVAEKFEKSGVIPIRK